MSTLLQIAQLGQPVLRQKAKIVTNVKNPDIQRLIDDLVATLMEAHGVGLSAPQVYQSLRVMIVASHPNPRYPQAPNMKPTAIINPKIISHSSQTKKDWEGCLSIPGIRGLIPRYTKISVSYVDRFGKKKQKNYTDFIARIFQHELDHLDGIVFLDRLETNKDIISEKEYQRLVSSQKKT